MQNLTYAPFSAALVLFLRAQRSMRTEYYQGQAGARRILWYSSIHLDLLSLGKWQPASSSFRA